jgi:soluble lytic murein transglycosylase-like protein
MAGRGAWNTKGVGGTKSYQPLSDGSTPTPGEYYFLGAGYQRVVNGVKQPRDANEYAVYMAVKAYQKALIERGFQTIADGLYGPGTMRQVVAWQRSWVATGDPKASVWGGIGPESSEELLRPAFLRAYEAANPPATLPARIVRGIIRAESAWDAGCVGVTDDRDVGLAQINAGAHPEWDTDLRLDPTTSFNFVISYLRSALLQLANNQRDAIASYNLGVGGARKWIAAGRPVLWDPSGSNDPKKKRNVKAYIDKILAG